LLNLTAPDTAAEASNGTALRTWTPMNIRFVSSLTPDDEERIAPGILNALGLLLDQLPLAYTLRIETSGGKILQHVHTGQEAVAEDSDHLATRPIGGALRPRSPIP